MKVRLRSIPVYSVPKEKIRSICGGPAYGLAFEKYGVVRGDLPLRVKNHVILHEQIHVKYKTGEILTNIMAGVRDPRGWIATATATLRDPQRREFYKQNFKEFFKKKIRGKKPLVLKI